MGRDRVVEQSGFVTGEGWGVAEESLELVRLHEKGIITLVAKEGWENHLERVIFNEL